MNKNSSFKDHIQQKNIRSKDAYVGVVTKVETRDNSTSIDDEYDFIDTRYTVYVKPLHLKSNTIKRCFFLNGSSLDLVIKGETVFCYSLMNVDVIIDKFLINAYLLNYSFPSDKTYTNISSDTENKDYRLQSIEKVKPFNLNIGSKAELGRNNQYMIFESGTPPELREEFENNKYVALRMGIREEGNEDLSPEDTFQITCRNCDALDFLDIDSNRTAFPDNRKDRSHVNKSDELFLVGRKFIVIYSDNILNLYSNIIRLDGKERIDIESKRINLGDEANQPVIKGNDAIQMISEMIDLMQNAQYITPAGSSTGANPAFVALLQQFRFRYLKNNNSPIHSKKTFIE